MAYLLNGNSNNHVANIIHRFYKELPRALASNHHERRYLAPAYMMKNAKTSFMELIHNLAIHGFITA